MITTDLRATVKHIKDIVDPELVLSLLGFKVWRQTLKELRGPCFLHRGANKSAFRFNLETKKFICFTKKCHENGNDLIQLVMMAKNVTFRESLKFLGELCGIDIDKDAPKTVDYETYERKKYISLQERLAASKELLPEVPEDLVKLYMLNRSDYYKKRGYDETILDYFEIGEAIDDFGIPRATIPIRDELGRLVSITGRRVDSDDPPKFKHMADFKKSKVLYNLNNALEFINEDNEKSIILVEGYSSIWNAVRFGFRNIAAAMGAEVNMAQVNLIFKHCLTVFIMFDGDTAGRKGAKISEKILCNGVKTHIIDIPDGKDPSDLSYKEFRNLLTAGGLQ